MKIYGSCLFSRIYGTLQKVFTFHKILLDRFLLFAISILNYENSPHELKEIIKLPDNSTTVLARLVSAPK